jgi:hypothetical protein
MLYCTECCTRDGCFTSYWFPLFLQLSHQLGVHLGLFLEELTDVWEGHQTQTCRKLMSRALQQVVQPSTPVTQDSYCYDKQKRSGWWITECFVWSDQPQEVCWTRNRTLTLWGCSECGCIHVSFVEHLKGQHTPKWTDLIFLVLAFCVSIC